MGGKLVILHRRGCNFAWIRVWIHLDPRGARMRQVYYLQHFGLDPCLDPLGSMMRKVCYLQHPLLGSVLGSTRIHLQPLSVKTEAPMAEAEAGVYQRASTASTLQDSFSFRRRVSS